MYCALSHTFDGLEDFLPQRANVEPASKSPAVIVPRLPRAGLAGASRRVISLDGGADVGTAGGGAADRSCVSGTYAFSELPSVHVRKVLTMTPIHTHGHPGPRCLRPAGPTMYSPPAAAPMHKEAIAALRAKPQTRTSGKSFPGNEYARLQSSAEMHEVMNATCRGFAEH